LTALGKVCIVGPLSGHWQDVPLRALCILQRASLVVAKDGAFARALLEPHGVHAPLCELEGYSPQAILEALQDGDVAWLLARVTELSGPAGRLFRALLERGVELVSVPGACAAIAGLVMSGLPADRFTFLGLLPESSKERHALLQCIAHERLTIVCEVTACCLSDALGDVLDLLGDRRIALCADQNVWRGRAKQAQTPSGAGQLTLVIEGAEAERTWSEERVRDVVNEMLTAGQSPRDVAREVAQRSGWPKREVYRMALIAKQGET
jgi:16S rRNA (cytidine1402-2'-O)-methyltransferase